MWIMRTLALIFAALSALSGFWLVWAVIVGDAWGMALGAVGLGVCASVSMVCGIFSGHRPEDDGL